MRFLQASLLLCSFVGSMSVLAEKSKTFVGLDVINNHLNFKKNYDTSFKKNMQALNIYVGHRFSKKLEGMLMEAGYEISNNRKKDVTANGGQYWLGDVVPLAYSMNFQTKIKMRILYVGVGSSYEVLPAIYINGSIGLGLIKIKALTELKSTNVGAVGESNKYKHFEKNKATPVLKLSLMKNLNNDVGVRAFGGWKMTKFDIKPKEEGITSRIKIKNSYSFGLGAFYNLPI